MNKRWIHIISGLALLMVPDLAVTHIGSVLLPEGCGSCHVGHGLSDEPMLSQSQEDACYQCHGSGEKQMAMKTAGKLADAAVLPDVEKEFAKPYRHPVEERSGHSPSEQLPDFARSLSAHAECVDCHNPHQRIRTGMRPTGKVSGYSLTGQQMDRAVHEYEICLKCHSDETSGAGSADNLRRQFSLKVRSMHPVTRPALGSRPASLKASPQSSGTMRCSDCHRSDNSDGPRGPHGSNYRFLLSGNYDISGKADESSLAYQFCYSCHERESILDNESFPKHREHIVGDPLRGISGTSCYTCHASHSSEQYPFLIRFNPEIVSGVQPGNGIEYRPLGTRSGECYLTCHGREHKPERY